MELQIKSGPRVDMANFTKKGHSKYTAPNYGLTTIKN